MSSRILGNNYLRSATITVSGADAAYPASNMVDGRTNTQAAFLTGATRDVIFDLGSSREINAFGCAKHNLADVGANITVQTSTDASTWNTRFLEIPLTNRVFMLWTTSVTHRYVRVRISGHTGTAYISDVTVGKVVDTADGQPVGFVEPLYAYTDEVRSNITRGNELAGITIVSKPREFKINVSNTDYSSPIIDNIVTAVTTGPFYFQWANGTEDGIHGRAAFCWLKNRMFQTRFDTIRTRAATIDCMGFV